MAHSQTLRSHGARPEWIPETWRKAAAARLEHLHDAMLAIIAQLDAMDSDTDRKPSICGSMGPGHVPITDDCEGGDVLDEGEPHDWDDEDNGDDELSLGRSNPDPSGIRLGWGYDHAGAFGGDDET